MTTSPRHNLRIKLHSVLEITVVQSDFLACSRIDVLSIFCIIIQHKGPRCSISDRANPELAETFETLYFQTQEDYLQDFYPLISNLTYIFHQVKNWLKMVRAVKPEKT